MGARSKSTASPKPALVWFRRDLRIEDHPALAAAVKRGQPVIPVFIWSPEEEGAWPAGGASRWWLHQSLKNLDARLRALKSRLIIRAGKSLPTLTNLIRDTGAGALYWNRRYEPGAATRDGEILKVFGEKGLDARSFHSSVLFEPWALLNKQRRPFQVFTPYWKACLAARAPAEPLPAPPRIPPPRQWPDSVILDKLGLEPKVDWAIGIRAAWMPGPEGARRELGRFLSGAVASYPKNRDFPALRGTSRLSPHLHFGEISPAMVWHALVHDEKLSRKSPSAASPHALCRRQLVWREFAHHLLYHWPHTADHPLRPEFGRFPWRDDPNGLEAWQKGRTGYPIVDAGMRELWITGWMHNRVRMIAASFLVKDLMVSWTEGARWFWETLVDADLANNTLGWQWTAGCGADAAPFFRIFNPVVQGEKFDPDGAYIRKWVPELRELPAAWIHKPWQAPREVLARAGVKIGRNYPEPVTSHEAARIRALKAFESLGRRKLRATRR